MSNVAACLRDTVSREIGAETVLWAHAPGVWAYGRRHCKTSLFGIPFTAFSVFWTLAASGRLESFGPEKSAPPFFTWWGLMFVGVGVAMLLAPLLAGIKAGRVYYVLTDKRAIIFEKLLTTKIGCLAAETKKVNRCKIGLINKPLEKGPPESQRRRLQGAAPDFNRGEPDDQQAGRSSGKNRPPASSPESEASCEIAVLRRPGLTMSAGAHKFEIC
jgi:hypothetical protein